MKTVKFVSVLLVVCMLAMTSASFVYASDDVNVVIGNELSFEISDGTKVEPFIYEERTMMPLRAISEALDATVFWFGDDQRIQIVSYDTLLSLQIGTDIMGKYKIINGSPDVDNMESIKLEVPPMIHNDRSYVPLRAISEAFDASISWNNPTRSAIIIPGKKDINNVTISEMKKLSVNTICSTYGVICKNDEGFYLRSLTAVDGEYSTIQFTTPKNTSISENTDYNDYLNQYFTEQFDTENPAGIVIRYTGVVAVPAGSDAVCAALDKTTTGIKKLGEYDEYMRSLGLEFTPFRYYNM